MSAKISETVGMASFKTLDQIGDIQGKRVLVRVDLNVPVDQVGQGH